MSFTIEAQQKSRESYRSNSDRRLFEKAIPNGDCREFAGVKQSRPNGKPGYGIVHRFGKRKFAHRHAWELVNGPIPDGMWVLHHCDNPPCINPAHLYLGTASDNTRDAWSRRRMYQPLRKRCSRGHPLVDGNLMISGGQRRCLTCYTDWTDKKNWAKLGHGPMCPACGQERVLVVSQRKGTFYRHPKGTRRVICSGAERPDDLVTYRT